MSTVSLYLDVDGVVSPFGPLGRTGWGSKWHLADAGVLEVAYAKELVAELNALAEEPGVRFVWLTSWEELAPKYLCPAIGLRGEAWPVLISEGWDRSHNWWKLDALQRDLEGSGTERFVWMDDQLAYEAEALSWAGYLGPSVLCISPDPREGLQPLHLEAIRNFLDAVLP
ncbi:HAD domain-containing protein [Arthrobacter sp. M4]|uniref:HAD domain-containing protein n=1 Tax=Arthrobacter sp. M4 TaxID=218160 RepID=UPI001CDBC658|nr:HAD domain-containing protein [Arthrobacter sp. M4]MCA4131561.1 hypothetical protein [Arthrobacter sp. M4]